MSEIITDKLTGKTSAGDVTITSEGGSATMQLQQGLAKIFAQINMEDALGIVGSFGASSFSDNATGDGHTNFTNSMNDTTYMHTGSVITKDGTVAFDVTIAGGGKASSPYYRHYSTSALSFAIYSVSASYRDEEFCHVIHGDLA